MTQMLRSLVTGVLIALGGLAPAGAQAAASAMGWAPVPECLSGGTR